MMIAMLILLSGDIEMNPGPHSIYPCGICEQKVDWSCRAMACDECNVWYHQSCASISNSTYNHHVLNSSAVWICHHCGVPNYVGSFTFHSYEVEVNNSFSVLEQQNTSSLCSPEAEFNPRHTSSPSKRKLTKSPHKTEQRRNNLKDETFSTTNSTMNSTPSSSNIGDVPVKGRNWRTLSLNINGLRSKTEELALAIEYLKPDVIIGCESKISKHVKNSELFPPNYQKDVFRKDRDDHGGGVFLAFKDGYNPAEIKVESTSESVWATVPMKKGPPLKLCSFYRPPQSGAQPIDDLNNQASMVNEKGDSNVIIAGDFNCRNIDWSIPKLKPATEDRATHQQLLDLLTDQSLTNVQNQNTREASNLDLFLTSNVSLIKSVSVIPGLSDHDMVVVDTDLTPTFNKSPPRRVYKYHKADWDAIKKQTEEFTSNFLRTSQNKTVNENWTNLKEHLKSMQNLIPSKIKNHRNRLPWMNTGILRLIRKKKRAYKIAKKRNNPAGWKKYNDLKKLVSKEIRQAHGNYIEKTLTNSLEEGNAKPFWSYIKERKRDTCGIAPLKNNGHLETDSSKKAEILAKQFSSVFTRDSDNESPITGGERGPTIEPIQITHNGVEKLLKSVKTSKAHGPDGIPNILLKNLATELTPALTFIFSQSLASGELPLDWKKANITPIFKKDDKHQPSNYRPVSLTCVCSKLMEHIIVSHLMNHLEKNGILTDKQHGFRRRRSCVTQLHLTTTDLAQLYDNNVQVDMCILDFSKAFDVVSHKKLISKLEHYGVRNNILKWIQAFLTDRQQSVVVDGHASAPSPVLSGVPQGTCLGPVLFLCYINDIGHHIKSDLRLFADDALLYRPIHQAEDQELMQEDLNKLQSWAVSWNMKFNPKKCYIMSLKRSGIKLDKFYTLRQEILQTVQENPYLGVLLSEDCSFGAHINNICTKASRTIGFLNRNLKYCPEQLRSTAYTTLCRPKLEYACQVWDPHLRKEIDLLEKIQRKGARMVTRDFRQKTSVSEMIKKLEWEPLETRRKRARLILFYQIIHEEVAVPINNDLLKKGRRGRYLHTSHHHAAFKHSFYPRTIRDWNNLTPAIKNSPDLDSFKVGLASPAF